MRLRAVLLVAVLLLPLFTVSVHADSMYPSLVNIDVVTVNNTLQIRLTTISRLAEEMNNTFYHANVVVEITGWTDVAGGIHTANKTLSKSFEMQANKSISFKFENLRPDPAAVSVSGEIQVFAPSGKSGVIGQSAELCVMDKGDYYAINVYRSCGWHCWSLTDVFGVQKQPLTAKFTLDFQSGALNVSRFSTLPSEWIAKCSVGDEHLAPAIPKVGPFTVVWYTFDPASASSILSDVQDELRTDSHNLSWISSFSIRSLNITQVKAADGNISNPLKPSDFSVLDHSADVVIVDLPDDVSISTGEGTAAAMSTTGWIFIKDRSPSTILYELGNQAGFPDHCGRPDTPYELWKAYWDSLVGENTASYFTNATWFSKMGNTKFWVTLNTIPICEMTHTINLEFNIKSDPPGESFSWSIEATSGSVDPSSGSAITPTVITTTFSAPGISSAVRIVYVTLHINYNGEERVFPFAVSVIQPAKVFSGSNVSMPPGGWYFNSSTSNEALKRYLDWVLNKSWDAENMNVSDPRAQECLENARRDYLIAKQDVMAAIASNDTCVARLLRDAAHFRIQAAEIWQELAEKYDRSIQIFGDWYFDPYSWKSTDDALLKQKARKLEAKASLYEMQAKIGCPSGALSSKYGVNPLLGLAAYMQGDLGLLGGFSGIIGVLGAILTAVGFLGYLLSNRGMKKFLGPGLVLLGIFLGGMIMGWW